MKRYFIFIMILSIGITTVGCKTKDIGKNNSLNEVEIDEDIKYTVEQIILSKTFQSTEPSIDVLTKSGKARVKASLGLTECSSVDVTNVRLEGSTIKIFVRPNYKEDELQIAVPQVIVELPSYYSKRISDYSFELVNEDPKPMVLKISSADIIGKVNSNFKISTSKVPEISLNRNEEDKLIWHIIYKGIFDKMNNQIPIINLDVFVDSETGEIIEFEKQFIASSLDTGKILSYSPNQSLLYKKTLVHDEKGKSKEEIWVYDLDSNKDEILYSSNFTILSGQFSDDNKYIAFLEEADNLSNFCLIDRKNNRPYQVFFTDDFNPKHLIWKDNNSVFLIQNKNDKAHIMEYNIKEDKFTDVAKIDKPILSIKAYDDSYLLVEADYEQNNFNKTIYITDDFKNFDTIDSGFQPTIIKDKMFYLKKDNKSEVTELYSYNLKKDRVKDLIASHVSNYQILNENSLYYVKKDEVLNENCMYKYNFKKKDEELLLSFVGDKSYLDDSRNTIYTSIILPFENQDQEMIYQLDIEEISKLQEQNNSEE